MEHYQAEFERRYGERAMSLLDLTLSWIRRSSRWELASIAFVVRAAASMLILAATLPGIQEAVMSSVQETLEIAANKIDSPLQD